MIIKKLFDLDSPMGRALTRLADLAVLSVLWTLCSLPVLTLGASSAALSRTAMNMVREQGEWNARAFFRYFRENFRTATALWLALLLIAAVLSADLWILAGAAGAAIRLLRLLVLLGAAVWTITAAWVFPMTAHFENTPWRTLKNALLLGISWLPRSLVMGVLWLLPAALAAFAPGVFSRIAVLWPVLLWGATAYGCARVLKKPLTPYWEKE